MRERQILKHSGATARSLAGRCCGLNADGGLEPKSGNEPQRDEEHKEIMVERRTGIDALLTDPGGLLGP